MLHELLGSFPARPGSADPELTALKGAENLTAGQLQEAERYLARAARGSDSVPAARQARFRLTLDVLQLQLDRQRGDASATADGAQRLLAVADAPEMAWFEISEDLRALALVSLGIAEHWTGRYQDAGRHLEQGVALAQRIDRPYLELTGRAHRTVLATAVHTYTRAAERGMEAVELAERHGWGDEGIVGVAYAMLGGIMVGRGRLEEAEHWFGRARSTLPAADEPAIAVVFQQFCGVLELASGRYERALDAFREVERLAGLHVTTMDRVLAVNHPYVLQVLVHMGDIQRAEELLAELDEQARETCEVRIAVAELRLAQGDAHAATAVLAPVLDDPAPVAHSLWRVRALLLEAIARDALGDADAAARALELGLDLAEPESILLPFLLDPAPELLDRHRRRGTAHASLVSEILDLQAASTGASPLGESQRLPEPLTESELRVMRYLPTNLSQREIAHELDLSAHTVKTQVEQVYAKLDVHSRRDAVERARSLGLLAPSAQER